MNKKGKADGRRSIAIKTCADCESGIDPNADFLKCCSCNDVFHIECVNITARQFRAIRDKTKWKCSEHEDNDSTTTVKL